ncbi:hypothetical protein BU17DRAFT_92906 [Hysterangium stoloniferum]|nr:hypothetical protein BU17DRAFT_92906 [Hysterangium stoloniferum]
MADQSVLPYSHIALSLLNDDPNFRHKTILRAKDRSVASVEIENLNRSIGNLEALESKLLQDLIGVRARLSSLQAQRSELQLRIAAVWTLPNEILSYIFEMGVLQQQEEGPPTPVDKANEKPVKPDFQVLVSHVSQLFRDVALHTPSLWTLVRVPDLTPRRLDYLRTFLGRSGSSSSLEIILDCVQCYPLEHDDIDTAMAMMVPHISRLRRFTARFDAFDAMHNVLKNLTRPAPLLEALELSLDCGRRFDETSAFEPSSLRAPLKLFDGHVPRLSALALDGVHVAWDQCNFQDIYDIHLGFHTHDVRPSWPVFKAIMDASPCLTILDLRGSAPIISSVPAEAFACTPARMESLMDMRISDISADYAANLISLFVAPNLQFLALTNLKNDDYSSLLDRIAGPPALFPNLESLKLSTVEANEDSVAALLHAFKTLKRLALHVREDQKSWLDLLVQSRADGELLCPKLEVLKCVGMEADSIKDMLQKRKIAGVPIPKLEIEDETAAWASHHTLKWLRSNTDVEIVEPSEFADDELSESGSEHWDSEDEQDFNHWSGIAPYLSFTFSDVDEGSEDDDDYDHSEMEEEVEEAHGGSEMEVDYTITDVSSGEEPS